MSVEAPPAPAEVEAAAESPAEPVAITETSDGPNWQVAESVLPAPTKGEIACDQTIELEVIDEVAEVLPPSLLSGEQLTLLYGKDYWLNPAYLAAYDAETNAEKERLLQAEDEIEDRLATLKTEVAEENAALKAARKRTKDYRRERRDNKGKRLPGRQLTIEAALPPDAKPAANADPGTEPVNFSKATEDAQKQFFDDLYDRFPVDRWTQFGATKADIEKLHAGDLKDGGPCPIVTMRDLRLFTNPYKENPSFTRTFRDFKGFGGKAVDRIQDAQDEFIDWWSNKGGQAEFARELGLTPPQTAEKSDGQEQRAGDQPAEAVPGGGQPADDGGAQPGADA